MERICEFIRGVDISSLEEMIDQGVKYYDFDGQEWEALDLLKKYGVNYIRLRLWHTPGNVEQSGGYCSLERTVELAKKVKSKGFHILLNFHYSDYWADPKRQNKPKAWQNLSFEKLVDALYEYTKNVLETFKSENVFPDMVQVGNEVRTGILHPDGSTEHWDQLATLFQSAIRAVRQVAANKDTKVMIHMDQGGRFYILKQWFDALFSHGVEDFDVIGLSYYPFWHGSYQQFATTLNNMAERYKKPIVVVETAQGWRNIKDSMFDTEQADMSGFRTSEENQRRVIELVMSIVSQVKHGYGLGIFYWEPLLMALGNQKGWGANLSMVNERGKVLEGLRAFEYNLEEIDSKEVVLVERFESIEVQKGEHVVLPKMANVLYRDGSYEYIPIQWEDVNTSISKTYELRGKVLETAVETQITVKVVDAFDPTYNMLHSSKYQRGLYDWDVVSEKKLVDWEIRAEFNRTFPQAPDHIFYFEMKDSSYLKLSQKIHIEKEANYWAAVKVKSSGSLDNNSYFYIAYGSEKVRSEIGNVKDTWVEYQIDCCLKKGEVEIGVYVTGDEGNGQIKDMGLFLVER